MRILFIAPLPPPITGNSLPVKILYDELQADNEITIINLSKNSFSAGASSIGRVFDILNILKQVWHTRRNNDLIYFTISESMAGNLKDIVIYWILRNNLSKVIIHMFGGAGMREILAKKSGFLYRLNRYFIQKIGGIIVEGQTQADFFAEVKSRKQIHVIPNFAEDFLFTNLDQIEQNFSDIQTLKLLFISNLIYGKGHEEIVEAYKQLSPSFKSQLQVDFAGRFESEQQKNDFLDKIDGFPNVKYHGLITGDPKRELYTNAHVFCLPTYYPYEGQPFCILEAYATGCVVITTDHSGIKNVFTDNENGYQVEKQSVSSIKNQLEHMLLNKNALMSIAKFNLNTAQNKYRTDIFKTAVKKTFRQVAGKAC